MFEELLQSGLAAGPCEGRPSSPPPARDHEEHLAEADALMQEREEILRHSGLSTPELPRTQLPPAWHRLRPLR